MEAFFSLIGKSQVGRERPRNSGRNGPWSEHLQKIGIGPKPVSDGHLGEDVHAADLGGHPEVGALLLDTDDRRLAADPALLAGGQFGRED